MRSGSFPAAVVLGLLACGAAKADVTYMFFDASDPTTVDLEFTVAAQLSPATQMETFISVGGAFASDFAGGGAAYLPHGPRLGFSSSNGFSGGFIFTGLPPDAVPGNGSFSGSGSLGVPDEPAVASLGSAAISGVTTVPEPSTWALLSLGFLGLAALSLRSKRDRIGARHRATTRAAC